MDTLKTLSSSFIDFLTSSWTDKVDTFKHLPIFTHPPYLIAFLICTLLPAILIFDAYGAREPPPKSKSRVAEKKTQ